MIRLTEACEKLFAFEPVRIPITTAHNWIKAQIFTPVYNQGITKRNPYAVDEADIVTMVVMRYLIKAGLSHNTNALKPHMAWLYDKNLSPSRVIWPIRPIQNFLEEEDFRGDVLMSYTVGNDHEILLVPDGLTKDVIFGPLSKRYIGSPLVWIECRPIYEWLMTIVDGLDRM
jgi:hypothetical protein